MAKKILVIDDSALMRRVISDIINESNEYEVAAIAKDGLEGLDMIVSNPYEYSAVILDINMPKLNGLELLQRLQKDHIEQTVIVVSTVAKEGAKETIQALEYGAFDFVTKPENYLETKRTAVRLIPAPGKTVGDHVEFGGLLGAAPVMAVHPESPAVFVDRGGRIPAPMQSLKN